MIVGDVNRSRTGWRLAALLLASGCCIVFTGCGNGLAKVHGKVLLDGQPLRGGNSNTRVTVQFQPANGIGSTAIGLADEDGNYTLATGSQDGIPPGEYLVTCTASELVQANASAAPSSKRITNPKYADARTSGLTFTVEPGNNEFDIPLESGAKPSGAGT